MRASIRSTTSLAHCKRARAAPLGSCPILLGSPDFRFGKAEPKADRNDLDCDIISKHELPPTQHRRADYGTIKAPQLHEVNALDEQHGKIYPICDARFGAHERCPSRMSIIRDDDA
jgi:hypothetical protein